MLDDFSKRTKAIRAALDLAAEHGWNDISPADIGARAGLNLADLRREFTCKSDVLKAFQVEVDSETLAKVRPGAVEQSPRDRLFDIIMTRFEIMAPYRPALRRISADLCCRPAEAAPLLCSSLASQYWMLAGTGAKLVGLGGAVRVTGLSAIYAKVFRTWLDDTSSGLDRTMAVLDRKLRKAERMVAGLESACQDFCRFTGGFMPRGWGRREAGAENEQAQPNSAAGA